MTIGLILTAFGLGLRHGVDWDHIAAIADLSAATDDRRDGFRLSFLYAVGHAVVVFGLGALLIIAGSTIPDSVDAWMGRVVGVTLVALGVMVLRDVRRHGGAVRLRSRWMIVIEGAFAGVRRVRRVRGRRQLVVEHDHDHDHEAMTDHEAISAHEHTHTHDHRGATIAQPVPAGPTRARRWWHHRHPHRHDVDLGSETSLIPPGASGGIATGVGMLHGVGIESPTQIGIFVASTSVVGQAGGLALLGAWVIGLVVANSAIAVLIGTGTLDPAAHPRLLRVLAVVVALLSIGLGLVYLLG